MNTKLYLSIDLGGDTIKICFGIKKNQKELIGKIIDFDSIIPDPIPAAAYYDEETGRWYYGNQIESKSNGSFLTVVKIKKLLGLLKKTDNQDIDKKNKEYYLAKNQFPKFFFPEKKEYSDNYEKLVEADMTFSAPGYTPRTVCENFFDYIANMVAENVGGFLPAFDVIIDSFSLISVAPNYFGSDYKTELNRLLEQAFSQEVSLSIDATRAMCYSAYEQGLLGFDDKALVFDLGEERISVVRATLIKDKDEVCVGVDAEDAHSKPIEIGGQTLDENIIDYLNGELLDRVSLGDKNESIDEVVLDSKQYLLLKNVKQAKMLLSDEQYEDDDFSVPLSIWKEVRVLKQINKNELLSISGISDIRSDSITSKIAKYVLEELRLTINYDINKVFLSGGLVESLGLFDFIKEQINQYCDKKVKVLKVEHTPNLNNKYDVLHYEDSVYCAALGGIKAALGKCRVVTILPCTYGTWGSRSGNRVLEIYEGATKGVMLTGDSNKFTKKFNVGSPGGYTYEIQEEVYSMILSPREIQQKKFGDKVKYYASRNGNNYLVIGKINSTDHKNAEKTLDLKLVSGGSEGKLIFLVNGKRVSIKDRITGEFTLTIDSKGHCVPSVKTCETKRYINYVVGSFTNQNVNDPRNVKTIEATKVEIQYVGVKEFESVVE